MVERNDEDADEIGGEDEERGSCTSERYPGTKEWTSVGGVGGECRCLNSTCEPFRYSCCCRKWEIDTSLRRPRPFTGPQG